MNSRLFGEPLSRFELLTYGLQNRGGSEQFQGVNPPFDPVRTLAIDVLVAAASGDPTAMARAIRLAEAVLRDAEAAAGEGSDTGSR